MSLVKSNARAKFDETIEISMNLGIDPRHADQMVRGLISLPNGTGKTVRIGVFARGAKAEEALAAGADVVGADDLAEKVQAGEIAFDRCIATPDMMGLVGRLGKILGPRGLMPNPKLGTVTMNVKDAVAAARAGQVEFRAEKAGIVHAGIGKGLVLRREAGREHQGVRRCHSEGQAGGGEGHLFAEGVAELVHGPRPARGCSDARRLNEIRPTLGDRGGRGRWVLTHRNLSKTARRLLRRTVKGVSRARKTGDAGGRKADGGFLLQDRRTGPFVANGPLATRFTSPSGVANH